VYFLFTLLHLQYTYTYTTTPAVVRDLLLCSMGKLLVMVALQVIGAGCYLLLFLSATMSVLILLFFVCLVVYFTVDLVYVVLQFVDWYWSLSLCSCGYFLGM
jgi:hypothetical protein